MRFRGWLYSLMMKSCGKNFQVANDVIINSLSGFSIGENVYIAPKNIFLCTEICIGNDVLISPNNVFSGGNHQFDGYSFRWLPSLSKGPIEIGKGSWVTSSCNILSGSTLPERSILAAGSVLNRKLTENEYVYAGSPARKIAKV